MAEEAGWLPATTSTQGAWSEGPCGSPKPLGTTQVALGETMGVRIQRGNTVVNGERGVTADAAILLADVLGTTPEGGANLRWRSSSGTRRGR